MGLEEGAPIVRMACFRIAGPRPRLDEVLGAVQDSRLLHLTGRTRRRAPPTGSPRASDGTWSAA
jgi:hypothetical protein